MPELLLYALVAVFAGGFGFAFGVVWMAKRLGVKLNIEIV